MRETRTSGSEGGGTDWSSLPLSLGLCRVSDTCSPKCLFDARVLDELIGLLFGDHVVPQNADAFQFNLHHVARLQG